jgi:hypothetical protein
VALSLRAACCCFDRSQRDRARQGPGSIVHLWRKASTNGNLTTLRILGPRAKAGMRTRLRDTCANPHRNVERATGILVAHGRKRVIGDFGNRHRLKGVRFEYQWPRGAAVVGAASAHSHYVHTHPHRSRPVLAWNARRTRVLAARTCLGGRGRRFKPIAPTRPPMVSRRRAEGGPERKHVDTVLPAGNTFDPSHYPQRKSLTYGSRLLSYIPTSARDRG